MPACYGLDAVHKEYCKLSVILFTVVVVYTINLKFEDLNVVTELETLTRFVHDDLSDTVNIIRAFVRETPIHYLLITWLVGIFLIPIASLIGTTSKSKPAIIVMHCYICVFRLMMVVTVIVSIISVFGSQPVRHSILPLLVDRSGHKYQTSLNVTENPLVRSYVPGDEFSRAVDHIQPKFQWRGINGIEDYGSTSLVLTYYEVKNHKRTASMMSGFELENGGNPKEMKFTGIQCINTISQPVTTGQRCEGFIVDFKMTPEANFGGSALLLILTLPAFLIWKLFMGVTEIQLQMKSSQRGNVVMSSYYGH